jgi:hypothetical protein
LAVANGGTGGTTSTGTGAVVLANSPALVTPALGTPASGTATNLTGLPPAGVVGTAAILGANTFTALQTLSTGANIASATAVDLTAATGNAVVITGTTPSTSLTMTAGQQMILLPSGAWPLTFHATTMNINGGASYTCAAGDRVYAVKDLANVIRVSVFKQDGTPVGVVPVASGGTAATTVNAARQSISLPALADVHTSTPSTLVDGQYCVAGAGSITFTLPASPAVGDSVIIKDGTGAASTTSFTVGRNGSKIASAASDLIFDKDWAEITLTYIDGTIGWSV